MGKVFERIDDRLQDWISNQQMFFVATAPLTSDGLVNVSPKGLDTFRILGPRTVAYLDLVGSGIETVAHLRENGRITLMFCAFEGPPKIVRLQGRGVVFEPGDAEYDTLAANFPENKGSRAVIRIQCDRISDSCGFGVPLMTFESQRPQMPKYADSKGPEGLREYQLKKNLQSLDGLPGLRAETLKES